MSDRSNEPLYKVRIYNDNRMTITLHEFNPTPKREPKLPVRNKTTPILTNMYMSCSEYSKLLKRFHRKLWERDFNQNNCVFITLTLNKDLGYHTLSEELRKFFIYVTRKFGPFEYVRVFELQEKIHRYHIHTILQFDNKPTTIDKGIIETLWGLGVCDVQPVYDIRGVIQYITKFKEQHIQQENDHFTYFRKGTRVITTSQHFGIPLNKESYREDYITHDHLNQILKYHWNMFDNGEGPFVRIDSHKHYDFESQESYNCWDKVFIRSTQEFVDRNFISLLSDKDKPP